MSTFGEDLIQSLSEALAHAKGDGLAIVHSPIAPREVRKQGQADAGTDGCPDGHERVRLPKMGTGNASRQRPGRDSSAHYRARAQRGQACIATSTEQGPLPPLFKRSQSLGDFLSREEDGIVALPALKGVDQLGCGAGTRDHQLVNHPKHAVYAKTSLGGNFAELGISGQQDPAIRKCGDQTETVVCREAAMIVLEGKSLRDFSRGEVVGIHPVTV